MKQRSTFFPSSEVVMHNQLFQSALVVKANPIGMVSTNRYVNMENERESGGEPHIGLEFDTADEARDFYNMYATKTGFKIRIGQLYRSRSDGSISSRRFVCAKEGFQLHSRTGCPAFIRVKRLENGRWVIDHFHKDHNHELDSPGNICPPQYQGKYVTASKPLADLSSRSGSRLREEESDCQPCPSGTIDVKRLKKEERVDIPAVQPSVGLEFNSANEAYKFYFIYAAHEGFKIRIGQLFRSKFDGSITSRRFVCSKEGHQHSRIGCGAYLRIKRQDSGMWVVDRLQLEHNHELKVQPCADKEVPSVLVALKEEEEDAFVSNLSQENSIGDQWYRTLLEYFQSKQSTETGFYYAVDLDGNKCRNLFWADGRSRFSCSQFGDAVVFDIAYKRTSSVVPFASFIGINNHRQPVLLGCALIADESKESYCWLFQTYLRAMSGRRPTSIITDQDEAVEQAVSQVFRGTRHCFSMWQMKKLEQEYLGVLARGNNFRYEYEKCVYKSQTPAEFDASWTILISRFNLTGNSWLKEMYSKRSSWVPLFLRGTFFAGLFGDESTTSYFSSLLDARTPPEEFVTRYERVIQRRREEEMQEDMNSCNSQATLRTKEPMEDQCRRLYTMAMFKVFQKELIDSYSYTGLRIYEEGIISKYLVKKGGSDSDPHTVSLDGSSLNANCSCQKFEYDGMLCRHILKVFQHMNLSEIPSRFILTRWRRNAKYALLDNIDPNFSSQELKAMVIWSLREEASNFVEAGTTSIDRYRLALGILREGNKDLCW
uniref:Protein FAR1-RELATED SEQUENCE n=1 Tax=Kalanchoe fedtschenkoi TaxID=63787 RepID=A0A7N0UNW7_KALFE